MTAQEFEREFDLLYNNIASDAAPSIDAYEKSVFLTKAQEEIVTALYDGSFEGSEKIRECLDVLVETSVLQSWEENIYKNGVKVGNIMHRYTSKDLGVHPKSKFFMLNKEHLDGKEILFITYEALIINDACGEYRVPVKPITQDEYHRVSKNPFRRARKREALRLNVAYDLKDKNGEYIKKYINEDKNTTLSTRIVEIIYPEEQYKYQIRYVRKPKPIFLYNETGLTIDGKDPNDLDKWGNSLYNPDEPCELNSIVHRIILERAVQLAAEAYKK